MKSGLVGAFLVCAIGVGASHATESPGGTRDGRTGLGKGLVINGELTPAVRNCPYVSVIQTGINWAELEPQIGKYNWSKMDDHIAECAKYNKQAAFLFVTATGKVKTKGTTKSGKSKADRYDEDSEHDNAATPKWLFDFPEVKRMGGIPSDKGKLPLYPVFWDAGYQKHLGEFLAAMAKRYDGNPRVEFIRMGGWQVATGEPSFYGGASELIAAQLLENGVDIKKHPSNKQPGDGMYARAVCDLIDLWYQHFKQTRMAVVVHFPKSEGEKSFEATMVQKLLSMKATIFNTGLNEGDKKKTREQYRRYHDESGCKVGWGGITHLGTKLSESELKATGRPAIFEAFWQGIGADENPKYRPGSRVSYLVFGDTSLDQSPEALKWAHEHLSQ